MEQAFSGQESYVADTTDCTTSPYVNARVHSPDLLTPADTQLHVFSDTCLPNTKEQTSKINAMLKNNNAGTAEAGIFYTDVSC